MSQLVFSLIIVFVVLLCSSCLPPTFAPFLLRVLAQPISSNSSSIADNNTNESSSVAPVTTMATTLPPPPPPPPKRNTLTDSLSKTKSTYCGLFELFFGVPWFATGNITLKEAVAYQAFIVPLFMTLLAHYENGFIVFDPDDFITTYFVEESAQIVDAIEILTGGDVLSIPHVRRRTTWFRETIATWVIRPPKDMLENVGISVQIKKEAFFCGLTYADVIPVGHVLLERRYATSQVFFVRGMLTLGDFVAFLTAASSVCMVPHALQRAHVLAYNFMCEMVDDVWYSILENPLQVELGNAKGSRARGALVGNICFFFIVAGGMLFVALCVTFWRRRRTLKWSWKRCFTLPDPEVDYEYLPFVPKVKALFRDSIKYYIPKKSIDAVRLPGILFVPYSFLVLGTSRASTELIRRSLGPIDVILALIGYASLCVGLYLVVKKVLKRTIPQTVSWVVTIPEKDIKIETRFDRFCEFVRYNSFRFTTSSSAWFSRAIAGEIKGGVGVTRTGERKKKSKHDKIDDDNDDDDIDEDHFEANRSSDSDDDDDDGSSNAGEEGEEEMKSTTKVDQSSSSSSCEDETGSTAKSQKSQPKNDREESLLPAKSSTKTKTTKKQKSKNLLNFNAILQRESNRSRYEKKFVEKYGSCFDGFHTLGYWWATVDVIVSFLVGFICGLRPPLSSVACSMVQMFLGVILATYLAVQFYFRPWTSLHNRFFGLTFGACNVAAVGINLFGSYSNNRDLQVRADTLDLATNGIALLKLFFDMVSLLLLPSLSGFFGYIFGSTSYQMMRQHAWTAEYARREKVQKLKEEEDALFAGMHQEEESSEDEEEEEHNAKTEEAENNYKTRSMPLRDPKKKYKVVRTVRVVRKIVKPVPVDVTPVGSQCGSDHENDFDEEEQIVNEEPFLQSTSRNLNNNNNDDDNDEDDEREPESEVERRRRGLTSLQRFMMI